MFINQIVPNGKQTEVVWNQLFEKGGRISVESATNAHQDLLHMRSYIAEMVGQRRKNSTNDVIGNLVKRGLIRP